MTDVVFGALVVIILLLLAALFVLEKRRQRERSASAARLEQLEAERRYEELDEEIEGILAEEQAADRETIPQSLIAFLKGRPTRHLTATGCWHIWHGVIAIFGIGFILFMVFRSAVVDPVVRLILLITFGVGVVILLARSLVNRSKREKEVLPADWKHPSS